MQDPAMSNEHLGLWADGEENYADALRQERDEQLADIRRREQLATSTVEQDQLAEEVKQVHETYKRKRAELPWLLF
jgi:hypothetical protein